MTRRMFAVCKSLHIGVNRSGDTNKLALKAVIIQRMFIDCKPQTDGNTELDIHVHLTVYL